MIAVLMNNGYYKGMTLHKYYESDIKLVYAVKDPEFREKDEEVVKNTFTCDRFTCKLPGKE